MNTMDFEKSILAVWASKLEYEWHNVYSSIYNKLGINTLKIPNFEISAENYNHHLAEWSKDDRKIKMSIHVLRKFEWNAVTKILKHEIAHQLVDEHFNLEGKPHGAAFELACKLLEIDPSPTISADELSQLKGGDEEIVSKIKKLLAKGSNEAVTEEEADSFLQKANELMLKYNVRIAEITKSGKCFVQRPVTGDFKRWQRYLYDIGGLMKNYYG